MTNCMYTGHEYRDTKWAKIVVPLLGNYEDLKHPLARECAMCGKTQTKVLNITTYEEAWV